MNKHFFLFSFFTFSLLALLFPELALAAGVDSVGQMADMIVDGNGNNGNVLGLLELLSGTAYLSGAFLGARGALQLKDNSENPNQMPIGRPLTNIGVSSGLLALPSFMSTITDSTGLNGSINPNAITGASTAGGQAGDLASVATSMSGSIPGLMRMVGFGGTIAGAYLMLRALYLMPQMQQGRAEPSKVMWHLISGVLLWSVLPAIDTTLGTMGGATSSSTNILTAKYAAAKGGDFDSVIAACLAFVQFVGLVAFVRGGLILKQIGENKDQAVSRALVFLLAGAACMNIGWTVKTLAGSIGNKTNICNISNVLCN